MNEFSQEFHHHDLVISHKLIVCVWVNHFWLDMTVILLQVCSLCRHQYVLYSVMLLHAQVCSCRTHSLPAQLVKLTLVMVLDIRQPTHLSGATLFRGMFSSVRGNICIPKATAAQYSICLP